MDNITEAGSSSFSPQHAVLKSFPSTDSRLATDQSFPLFPKIIGDNEYRKRLDAFCSALLREIIEATPEHAVAIKRAVPAHLKALKYIVHSLAHVASKPCDLKGVSISLNKSDYAPGKTFASLAYQPFKRIVASLTALVDSENHHLCTARNGWKDRETGKGLRTRLIPTIPMNDRMVVAGLVWETHPQRLARPKPLEKLVYIKDRATKERHPIQRPLNPNEEVLASMNRRLGSLRAGLALPNYREYLKLWDFRHSKPKVARRRNQLHRQFVDHDESGGRIFGHEVQTMPNSLRRFVTFNELPTVEYDYQAAQLHFAYELVGVEAPPGDPYLIPGYATFKDRRLFKRCFVSAIGASEKESLTSLFSNAIKKELGTYAKDGLASEMAEAFWKHHSAIAPLACTQAWRKLQYMESEVALSVLTYLDDRDIACIPIHDSMMVSSKHEAELVRAMEIAVQSMASPPRIVKANTSMN